MNRGPNIALALLLLFCLGLPVPGESALPATPGREPRVALVLAGGGARGLAHIGVIRRLEELGLPVDVVCGTSMGALVGGLWSLGWSGRELDSLARHIDWAGHFSDDPPHHRLIGNARFLDRPDGIRLEIERGHLRPPGQLFHGSKVELLLSDLTQGAHGEIDFLALPRSFACAATDLERGKAVYLEHGSLSQSLRASMSLPSLFEPVRIDGRVLVDGGLVQNLPVDLALRLDVDLIIGVDLPVHLRPAEELGNLLAVAEQSRQILSLSQEQQAARMADLLVRPEVSRYGLTDFEAVDTLIQRGYEAMCAAEPRLRELLAERGVELGRRPPPHRLALPDTLWLASLSVEGRSAITLEQAERLLDLKRGDLFSPREVSRRVRNFISSGSAQKAGYQIILTDPDAPPRPGRHPAAALLLEVEGPGQAWLDVNPGYSEREQVRLGLTLDWDRVTGPGSRIRLDGRFGRELALSLEAWRSSFHSSGLYLHPYSHYSSEDVEVGATSGRSLASYQLNRADLGLGAGLVLRRGARLEAMAATEWTKATPEVADTSWVRVRERAHAAALRLDVDTRNALDFPTHGFTLSCEARLLQPIGREADSFTRGWLSTRAWHSLDWLAPRPGGRGAATAATEAGSLPRWPGLLTLEAGAQAGRVLKGQLSTPYFFPFGGWPEMPGLEVKEFWVPEMLTGWLGLRLWLGRAVSVMPVAAWGRTRGGIVEQDERSGAGLGLELAARTLLGPLKLAAGARPGEKGFVYLRYGWEY